MRPEHAYRTPSRRGVDACTLCGLTRARHRKRTRDRTTYQREYQRKYRAANPDKRERKREHKPRPTRERPLICIDGEGFTDRRGRHHYVYMAACTEDALVSELSRKQGIIFSDAAEWLLSLPRTARVFGYFLGYDLSKIFETLPNAAIYALMHPENRQGRFGPRPIRVGDWRINLMGTKFSIKNAEEESHTRIVWDLQRFFQCSFVKALRAWSIDTCERCPDVLAGKKGARCGRGCKVDHIERMKAKRGKFSAIDDKEQAYCRSECMLLAKLARALLKAHEDEGLRLPSYYGPGSTAGVILKACGAKEQRARFPPKMGHAVECAYFGGRFESSHVGPIA